MTGERQTEGADRPPLTPPHGPLRKSLHRPLATDHLVPLQQPGDPGERAPDRILIDRGAVLLGHQQVAQGTDRLAQGLHDVGRQLLLARRHGTQQFLELTGVISDLAEAEGSRPALDRVGSAKEAFDELPPVGGGRPGLQLTQVDLHLLEPLEALVEEWGQKLAQIHVMSPVADG